MRQLRAGSSPVTRTKQMGCPFGRTICFVQFNAPNLSNPQGLDCFALARTLCTVMLMRKARFYKSCYPHKRQGGKCLPVFLLLTILLTSFSKYSVRKRWIHRRFALKVCSHLIRHSRFSALHNAGHNLEHVIGLKI